MEYPPEKPKRKPKPKRKRRPPPPASGSRVWLVPLTIKFVGLALILAAVVLNRGGGQSILHGLEPLPCDTGWGSCGQQASWDSLEAASNRLAVQIGSATLFALGVAIIIPKDGLWRGLLVIGVVAYVGFVGLMLLSLWFFPPPVEFEHDGVTHYLVDVSGPMPDVAKWYVYQCEAGDSICDLVYPCESSAITPCDWTYVKVLEAKDSDPSYVPQEYTPQPTRIVYTRAPSPTSVPYTPQPQPTLDPCNPHAAPPIFTPVPTPQDCPSPTPTDIPPSATTTPADATEAYLHSLPPEFRTQIAGATLTRLAPTAITPNYTPTPVSRTPSVDSVLPSPTSSPPG